MVIESGVLTRLNKGEKDDYFKLRVVGERIADDKKQIFGRRSLCILRLSL